MAKTKRKVPKKYKAELTPDRKLEAKIEVFCHEYIKDFNGTRAAIAAGYSPVSAHVEQNKLRKRPEVMGLIHQLMHERKDALKIEAQDVLARLWQIGNFDIGEIFDENNALLPMSDIPEDIRKSIASLDIDEITQDGASVGQSKKIKIESRLGALRDVGRHLGMWNDKLELGGSVELTDEQLEARIAEYEAKCKG